MNKVGINKHPKAVNEDLDSTGSKDIYRTLHPTKCSTHIFLKCQKVILILQEQQHLRSQDKHQQIHKTRDDQVPWQVLYPNSHLSLANSGWPPVLSSLFMTFHCTFLKQTCLEYLSPKFPLPSQNIKASN